MRGDRLRALRTGNDEAQSFLAELVGVTEATIANYENGRSEPAYLPLLRIAAHYGVNAEYLVGMTDDPARITNVPPEWEHMVNKAIRTGYTAEEMEKAFAIIAAIKATEDAQGRKA